MTFTIDATWEDGVLKPTHPVALPDGAKVRVSITLPDEVVSPNGLSGDRPDPLAGVIGIGDGPLAGDAADKHDEYIYGQRRP